MANITLVSDNTARKGARFTFLGPADACSKCSLLDLCTTLRIGGRYEIVDTRGRKHQCPVFDGEALVVEYRALPLLLVIESGKMVEGAVISYKKENCDNIGCPIYRKCGGSILPPGTRLKILKIEKSRVCARGKKVIEIEADMVD